MRILIANQFFWPDVAPTGQYLGDLARRLVSEGHEVTVICSGGSYTEAGRDDGEPPPVRIIRIPGFSYRRGALARLVSYSTFLAGAVWHEFRVQRPDILISMSTPPLLGVAGSLMKIRDVRHYIWEMDLFPDALVSLGVLAENGPPARLLGWIQDWARRRSNGVIVPGPCMRARLLRRGTPAHLVHVAENWADGAVITSRPNHRSGPLNVFYSGNFGVAHDTDTIAGAMRHFRNRSDFVFTFAGGGVGRARLQALCSAENIQIARFLPYANRREMGAHLAQADIGLVTQRPECVGTVVPSKVYGLMAAGRPVLFIGPKEATPALLIRRFRCGWQIDAGDIAGLIGLLECLLTNRDEARASGWRARTAFEQSYDVTHGVSRVSAALGLDVKNPKRPWGSVRAHA
jgi:putative colanic acid biosynthesis glycosyltransferase WcaI